MKNENLLKDLDYCKAICRDNISIWIPKEENVPCVLQISGDKTLYPYQDVRCIIDRETAIALNKLLDKE